MTSLRIIRPLALLLCGGLLTTTLGACGQKGPLYLPEPVEQQDEKKDEKKDEKQKGEPARADAHRSR